MKQSKSAKKPTASTQPTESASPVHSDLDLPEDGGIRLKLPGFEGPLDLLLHLIQEHELDILNIPIAFVTKRYLEYIDLMQDLNIDIASEYLVMAATLAHIKSRSLLPSPPADLEEGEDEELDPRAELIRRLLEYQKYKKAAEELASRSVLGRDVFVRGALPTADPTTAPLAPVGSFKLLEAFQRVLDRAKIVLDHQIEFERFSLSDRINQLVDMLKNRGRVTFDELFEGQRSRPDLIVTFLALLELTRLRMTRLFQEAPLEPILVELAVSDEESQTSDGAAPAQPNLDQGEAQHLAERPEERREDVPAEANPDPAEDRDSIEEDGDEDSSDEDSSDEDGSEQTDDGGAPSPHAEALDAGDDGPPRHDDGAFDVGAGDESAATLHDASLDAGDNETARHDEGAFDVGAGVNTNHDSMGPPEATDNVATDVARDVFATEQLEATEGRSEDPDPTLVATTRLDQSVSDPTDLPDGEPQLVEASPLTLDEDPLEERSLNRIPSLATHEGELDFAGTTRCPSDDETPTQASAAVYTPERPSVHDESLTADEAMSDEAGAADTDSAAEARQSLATETISRTDDLAIGSADVELELK